MRRKNTDKQDKQKYLDKNYPLKGTLKLTDRRFCKRCKNWFTIKDFIAVKENGKEFICCPTPDCEATPILWSKTSKVADLLV